MSDPKKDSPYQQEVDKAKWRKETFEQARQQLESSPAIAKLKTKYSASSVDNFVDKYARDKVRVLEWGPQYKQWNENHRMQWIKDAWEALEEIQQKKLFNLQCLWRAGKEELDGVEITFDFLILNNDILNCSIVPPIEEDEIELYRQYIFSNNYEHDPWHRWQDYDSIKEAYHSNNEDGKVPEWYEFYDGRKGTSVYMTFPDVKGEREAFYQKLQHKEYSETHKEEIKQKQQQIEATIDKRPHLDYHNADMIRWFVETFEDQQTKENMELSGGPRSFSDSRHRHNMDTHLLEAADEKIPLEAWYDWREAIERAAHNYRRKKIAEALPAAFEQYQMHRNMNIPFPSRREDDNHLKELQNIKSQIIERIKKGRMLNGESPDLDY
jgi:hypothetical protein